MSCASDDDLRRRAAEKAATVLPRSMPDRDAKLQALTERLLKRFREEAGQATAPVRHSSSTHTETAAAPRVVCPTELPPPQDGVEAVGDDPWFVDAQVRLALREAVEAAHRENKILVGNAESEIARICPRAGGANLGAGGVLRLGGSHLGGFGEADIAYAYRQLSRALHPDKNRDNEYAPSAFRRLSEAAEELRASLTETRTALHFMSGVFCASSSEEALVRPQEALFAEASRLACTLLGLATEGNVPPVAQSRLASFLQSSAAWAVPRGAAPMALLQTWHSKPELLAALSHRTVRNAYDCAPKRYRGHFLCCLSRLALLEGHRSEGRVRGEWEQLWRLFPELALWQELRERLQKKCFQHGRRGRSSRRSRSRSRDGAPPHSQWAIRWRKVIRAVLPGPHAPVPWSDPEVRKLCAALWRDFVDPLKDEPSARRAMLLFQAEGRDQVSAATPALKAGSAPAEWAYVPGADLILTVGEGMVGITLEGVFGDSETPARLSFASAIFQSLK
mmetsp:Transcript_8951/g.24963  ORF Transcript_8951/g.24963 Transcript_8951/m.24963 type:complete len:507 (-) Transcript_8951:8-1528(-)